MSYQKTVLDQLGDPVLIEQIGSFESVWLEVKDGSLDRTCLAELTPKQARKVAKALKRAAKAAEAWA